MNEFRELLAVTSLDCLRFFHGHLKEARPTKVVTKEETLYVASVLAHHASTSSENGTLPGSLYDIMDTIIVPGLEGGLPAPDPEILEEVGSQILLFTGFFRDQMRHRHNMRWYETWGQAFLLSAGNRIQSRARAAILVRVAANFSLWTHTCCSVSRTLREQRYMLKMDG